jgi:hypothetical protein
MLEDFWLPRREGGKGTEITTLPGGQNLGELEDVKYFQKKLYGALSVPISRLEPNQGFSLGRVSEITRDELKFSKFVDRIRNKFAEVFDQALRVQCVLKGICTAEEWDLFKENIYYDYIKDNNFTELKEAELMKERLSLLAEIDPYTGRYFSQQWIQRNVLRLTDDQIAEMQTEIDAEKEEGLGVPVEVTNQVAQAQMVGQVDAENQVALANAMPAEPAAAGSSSSSSSSSSKPKPKTESKPVKGDLSLKEGTFDILKRIL